MDLHPGARFGSYQILSLLGRGGMGEVHRAHDSKLRRDVAIKVLPVSLATDPERLRRFEREAQVLASLNHTHIAAIYGVEECDNTVGLILELVEGDTLEELLLRGAFALEDALPIARQMANALEAAHEKGIVHRDLKPSNVKVTPDAVCKVLDFGIAKANTGLDVDPSQSPTMAVLTHEGEMVGTAAYMSPEQARGKAADRRADIWAFGCVLYEMLTGGRAFAGDNIGDTISAVLEREPDWSRLPERTPAAIRRLLRRCLAKDLRERWRDIGDARLEIDEALAGAPETEVSRATSPAQRDVKFRRLTDFVGLKESPAISPDGKMVAFVSFVDGKRQIWIRLLAGGAPLQVTRDAVHHQHPRWSPDSSALLYYTPSDSPGVAGTLWEVSAFGGRPRRIGASIGGGDMSHDGRRIALFRTVGEFVELAIVTRDGNITESALTLPGGFVYSSPRWSNDDRTIACQRGSTIAFEMSVCVRSVRSGIFTPIASAGWIQGLCWLPDDSGLVYSSSLGSTLLYPPVFNLRSVTADGALDSQLTFGDGSYVEPDSHSSGRLVATLVKTQSDVWRFATEGTPRKNTRGATRITTQTGQVQVPSASPDDRQIVYLSDNGGHSNLWVVNTDGTDPRQITFEEDPRVSIGAPIWAPAGNRIVFVLVRLGHVELWLVEPDGSGLRQIVSKGWYPCWATDARWLYYNDASSTNEIHKIEIDTGTTVHVRDDGRVAAVAGERSVLYYLSTVKLNTSTWGDVEVRRADPEDGPSEVLARLVSSRVRPLMFVPALSPDSRMLAMPLLDGPTMNLWVLPTSGEPMRPVTSFDDRSVLMTRQPSWSSDSRHLYAAVAKIESDVVLAGRPA